MGKLDKVMSKVSGAITKGLKWGFTAAAGAAVGLYTAMSKVMEQFSKVEDAEAAFTPLLGGTEKAKKMVEALNKTAATTPFQFENLSDAARQLLPNMGGDIEKTISTIRMLGDTAGGNAQKMDSIVRGYNKALLKGKVDMEALNMIAEAGVPIFGDLGKVVGKSGNKLFKAISAGKIKTADLTEAFRRMAGEGGIFFRGMEIASETLSGKISTLKDNVGLAVAEFGSALAPTIKDTTDDLIDLAKQGRAWVTANKELIRSKFVEYVKKAPMYFEKIAYWLPKIAKGIAVFYALNAAIKVASVSMSAFNALANVNFDAFKQLNSTVGDIPSTMDAGSKSVGKFKASLAALTTFAIGWEIGTILYDQLVSPFLKARHQAKLLRAEVDQTSKSDLSKRPTALLENDLKKIDKAIANERKDVLGNKRSARFASGMSALGGGMTFESDAEKLLVQQRARINQALNLKRYNTGPMSDEWSSGIEQQSVLGQRARINQAHNLKRYDTGPMSDEWSSGMEQQSVWRPQVTERKETVEVVIRDESGKAEVTKGRANVKMKQRRRPPALIHTGAMP
jgi:tape measure domain-containing protein